MQQGVIELEPAPIIGIEEQYMWKNWYQVLNATFSWALRRPVSPGEKVPGIHVFESKDQGRLVALMSEEVELGLLKYLDTLPIGESV